MWSGMHRYLLVPGFNSTGTGVHGYPRYWVSQRDWYWIHFGGKVMQSPNTRKISFYNLAITLSNEYKQNVPGLGTRQIVPDFCTV